MLKMPAATSHMLIWDSFEYFDTGSNEDCFSFTANTKCFDRFGNFDNEDDACNRKFAEIC